MATAHSLGFGNGKMIDHGDGTASYKASQTFSQAFRVRIADVTGFSVSKKGQMLLRTLKILGNGTELASVSVKHGVSERIEDWFRAHPDFRGTGKPPASEHSSGVVTPVGRSVADELTKLVSLRDAGVLTDNEFAHQKAKLLDS